MNFQRAAPFSPLTMPAPRPLIALLLLILALPALGAADPAEREALRFNDAVTKLMQTRDDAQANLKQALAWYARWCCGSTDAVEVRWQEA